MTYSELTLRAELERNEEAATIACTTAIANEYTATYAASYAFCAVRLWQRQLQIKQLLVAQS